MYALCSIYSLDAKGIYHKDNERVGCSHQGAVYFNWQPNYCSLLLSYYF